MSNILWFLSISDCSGKSSLILHSLFTFRRLFLILHSRFIGKYLVSSKKAYVKTSCMWYILVVIDARLEHTDACER